jgi:hypothetical protein
MHFINEKLNTELQVIEKNNELYFDMEEVAKGLGVRNPRDSVRHFLNKYPRVKTRAILGGGRTYFNEGDVYLYTLRSRSEKAEEFQEWVAQEVLPTIRRVGLQAVKELEVLQFIAQSREVPLVEELPHKVSDEFLIRHGLYRTLGYLPPSEFCTVEKFYRAAIDLGYLDEQGELLDDSVAIWIPKYHNSYTQCGKWFAWTQQAGADIALRAKQLKTAAELLFEAVEPHEDFLGLFG